MVDPADFEDEEDSTAREVGDDRGRRRWGGGRVAPSSSRKSSEPREGGRGAWSWSGSSESCEAAENVSEAQDVEISVP